MLIPILGSLGPVLSIKLLRNGDICSWNLKLLTVPMGLTGLTGPTGQLGQLWFMAPRGMGGRRFEN
jgi:hypothetical protein